MLGSGIGGLLARQWGVTAPFWFAFVGSAVFVVLIWGQLRHIAHTDEAPSSTSRSAPAAGIVPTRITSSTSNVMVKS